MAYTDLTSVKSYLKIENDSQDMILQSMIDATTGMIASLIGFEPKIGTRTEQVSLNDFVCQEIYLHTPNITQINKINGITYTGVLGEDYIVSKPNKRKLIIRDLSKYLYNLKFDFFDIEYEAGYEDGTQIITDLSFLQTLIVQGEYNGGDIKTETMGPRSVTFKDKQSFDIGQRIVGSYRILNVM